MPWLTHCQFIEAAKAASGRLSFVAVLEQQLPVDTGILPARAFTSGVLQQLSAKLTLHDDQCLLCVAAQGTMTAQGIMTAQGTYLLTPSSI